MNKIFLGKPSKNIIDYIKFKNLLDSCILNLPFVNNIKDYSKYNQIKSMSSPDTMQFITDSDGIKSCNWDNAKQYIAFNGGVVSPISKTIDNYTVGCWIKARRFVSDNDSTNAYIIPIFYYCQYMGFSSPRINTFTICKQSDNIPYPHIKIVSAEFQPVIQLTDDVLPKLNTWQYVSLQKQTLNDSVFMTYRILDVNYNMKKVAQYCEKFSYQAENQAKFVIGCETYWNYASLDGNIRNFRLFDRQISDQHLIKIAKMDILG